MRKVMITAALTGARQGKEANPNIPIAPREIVDQALECLSAGAAIIHVHARDTDGKPTADRGVFREIVDGIKERSDAVLCLSTGGAASIPLAERVAMVPSLRPDLASFSVGSGLTGRYDKEKGQWAVDFNLQQSFRDLEFIARTMSDSGVRPELEIYDLGMISNALLLRDIGAITEPLHFNFVLGMPGQGPPPTVKNYLHCAESIPAGSTWHATGIGRHEFEVAAMAVLMGGHVRVGLEDNIYLKKGVLAPSNASLVEKAKRIIDDLGCEPATPAEAREILRLGR
jgi:3-keto-5-aminohexanoate cleavage enzyme